MPELEHGEVEFDGGFAALFRQHVRHQILHQLAASVCQFFLNILILLLFGDFHDCYKRLWHGSVIAHLGTSLYKIDPDDGEHEVLMQEAFTESKGAGFFVFDNVLYYIGGGKFVKIDEDFTASEVEPYIPTVTMNMRPSGVGGTTYQPENRIAAGKTVMYTSDGTSTDYQLPYTNLDEDENHVSTAIVEVNVYDSGTQTYSWQTLTAGTDYTVDGTNGIISFTNAPAQEDPENPNNVKITCYKTNDAAASNILDATCLSVYGGDADLAVVVGGSPTQANAYYWSGNTSKSIDPTYFPMDYYNLAGADANNKITGFGRQQGLLIIFQEHTVGKAVFKGETISDRAYLSLNYVNINDHIGCDIPGSIQLINNNLVFANTYDGVLVLANSTPADENNVRRLSKNVNGNSTRGLLSLLSVASVVTSFDDGERYWLVADGKVYLWDYELRGYQANEENLSWFYFEGINAAGTYLDDSDIVRFFTPNGSHVEFTPRAFNDFGEPIERRYSFAIQYFGTYEAYKDVLKVVFAIRSDTGAKFGITYATDWETRDDRTPVYAAPQGIVMVPYNITDGYDLRVDTYAGWATRIPRCFHIQHFGMTLYNNEINNEIGLLSAQIFYRYVRDARESHGVI